MKKEHAPLAVVGFSVVVLFLGWLAMSRPDDSGLSSSGFDLRGAAAIPARAAAKGLAPSREPTSSLMSISRTPSETAPPPQPEAAQTAPPPAQAAAPVQEDTIPAASPAEAGAFGISEAILAKGFANLAWRITDHPRILKFVLNSKTLNNVVFARPFTQKICNDTQFAKSYFANGSDPKGISMEMADVADLLKKPESAKAAAESEFAKRILACPTWDAISHDSKAVTSIAASNPALLPYMADNTALDLIGGNPRAQDILLNVQSSLESAPAPR